ncbi:MAG: YHS domain-containing protein [Candidatus Microsaccharimonas sp.]
MHNEETPSYAIDVVCGMEIPIKGKMIRSKYKGQTYYFCSLHCKEHFDNAPDRYLAE